MAKTLGVSIGVPRYSFTPRAGDVFYISGKTATVKKVGQSDGSDYVWFTRPVDGTVAMSVSNLYQIAKVPTSSRFAPYGQRTSNPRGGSGAAIPRGRWVNAQVMVTSSGKIKAKIQAPRRKR